VRPLIAFLFLIVMLAIGARVRGVRDSWWKMLAFITACVVVLALLLAILAE
jgi:hydrogenase/urease accessory protein HupE